jgi:hypothetical protein
MKCEPILWMGLTDSELCVVVLIVFVAILFAASWLIQRKEK